MTTSVQYTPSQSAAMTRFEAFFTPENTKTMHVLLGTAGTGKSFLVGKLFQFLYGKRIILAAPTHKAVNVSRRFLSDNGVAWTSTKEEISSSTALTGTTAQLLGIGPVLVDDEKDPDRMKQSFQSSMGGGLLKKIHAHVVLIEEVSMLGREDLRNIFKTCKARKIKLVIIGDPGQIPPVKSKAIEFSKIPNSIKSELTETVRQAEGSSIIEIATAIRTEKEWSDKVNPPESELTENLLGEFLDQVENPQGLDEVDRCVFIAYRNLIVDRAQEAACQKVYGHSAQEFRAKEVVIAERPFYENYRNDNGQWVNECLIANQDEMVVEWVEDREYPGEVGLRCQVKVLRTGRSISRFCLSEKSAKNPDHPFHIELADRLNTALEASKVLKKIQQSRENNHSKEANARMNRSQAWAKYFEWKDRTVLVFRHVFASTSHKSQGSTYRRAFVDVGDMSRFDRRALYVAVTRPRERLVLGS